MYAQLCTGSRCIRPIAGALLLVLVTVCSAYDIPGIQQADLGDFEAQSDTQQGTVQPTGDIFSDQAITQQGKNVSSHKFIEETSQLSFGIYNQETFHFEVLAGFIDLVASLKPRSMQAYVKRVNPEGIVRDYGFDDLVSISPHRHTIKTMPCNVDKHDVMIFISPEYNLTSVNIAIKQSGARMVVHLIHNGDSTAIEGLLALHPHTRIITLAPHVLAFLHKRLNKSRPPPQQQQQKAESTAANTNEQAAAVTKSGDNASSDNDSITTGRKLLVESDTDGDRGAASSGVRGGAGSRIVKRRRQVGGKALRGRPMHKRQSGPRSMQAVSQQGGAGHVRGRRTASVRRRAFEKGAMPGGRAMKVQQSVPAVPAPIPAMNVSQAQWRQLKQQLDWMLPIMDWQPRQECKEFSWGDCLDGFSIQGQADPKRRNYTYVFGGLRSSRLKCYGSKECRQRLGFIRLRMLGCNPASKKTRLGFPVDIAPMIERLASVNFQPFYEDIYTTAALIAAPGATTYFDRKFSSTIISSLVTGVPVILNNSFLRAYTFLSKNDIVHQPPGMPLDGIILQVLSWDASQHAARRKSLRQLRQRLFDQAAQKLVKMMREEGVLGASPAAVPQ